MPRCSTKLATLAESVRAEGWSWVETRASFGYGDLREFGRIAQEEIELPAEEAAELERLITEQDKLADAQYDEDGEEDPAVTVRLETIVARMEELEAKAHAWTPEQMAQAGAIVSLSHDGEPEVEYGLMWREDGGRFRAVDEAEGDEVPSPARRCPRRSYKS